MRKIKVWGGTHPDEIEPMELVDSLMRNPLPYVSAGIVNLEARRLGKRLVDINMNAAYPGDPSSALYEERRAPEVLRASKGFDTVIDLHTFNGGDTFDVAHIGSRGVSKASLGFLSSLGIRKLIYATHNTMSDHVADGFLLDLSRERYAERDFLCAMIDRFANGPDLGEATAADFTWFAHAGDASVSQYEPGRLLETIRQLDPVPDAIAPLIGKGLPGSRWLVFAEPNEQGYWAELCVPIEPPDDSLWPKAT